MRQWLHDRAAERVVAGMSRSLVARHADDPSVDVASNDYLGLSRHPAVIEAAVSAVRMWGAGSTASRLVRGDTDLHRDLEAALAALTGAARTLVFSSGYLANLAAITALSDRDTLLVSDAYNHASIIDACRLSPGTVAVFPHRDVDAARHLLAERTQSRALLITDAVFSVDGDLAPLTDLHAAARAHHATLIVDEAHTVGVLGAGAGAGPIADDVVRTFTLSKALGSQGGGVAGSAEVIDHLINTARPFIFDTGLAPAPAAAALAATRLVAADPGLPDRVLRVTRQLASAAEAAGWPVHPFDAAVASLLVGDPHDAVRARDLCAEHGVAIGCFRPPSVPDGIARLRMTGHADLDDTRLTRVSDALSAAREALSA